MKFTVQLTDYPSHSVNIVTHTTQIVLLLMWLSHEIKDNLNSFFFLFRSESNYVSFVVLYNDRNDRDYPSFTMRLTQE